VAPPVPWRPRLVHKLDTFTDHQLDPETRC
jgi:hypothetical protein